MPADDPSELFGSTASYYARYRPRYPQALFDRLIDTCSLDRTQTALDLGCGPGQIALPLAAHVDRVIAVDPEPGMLEHGRRLAAERGIGNIDWRRGDSYTLGSLDLPTLNLVTIGAAFHWTDRDALLAELDTLVAPGGAVVIASGGPPKEQNPPAWVETIADVRARYLGPTRRAGSGTYSHPAEQHEDVLARSPFSQITKAVWTQHLTRDLDSVIGLQYSYSYSSPAQFGDEHTRKQFERDLRDELARQFPDGDFNETVYTVALIAGRP